MTIKNGTPKIIALPLTFKDKEAKEIKKAMIIEIIKVLEFLA
jgi:hypothetical protein